MEAGLCACGCGERTQIATRNDRRRGQVKGEPLAFLKSHRAGTSLDRHHAEDRGYTTPCWIWDGAPSRKGYGRKTVNGVHRNAHRAVYEAARGPLAPGLVLDHLCRVRACVNPDHMEPVTSVENTRRGDLAALTLEQAQEIQAATGTHRAIAARYGVNHKTVASIKQGHRWADKASAAKLVELLAAAPVPATA